MNLIISAIMPTRSRPALSNDALACFRAQTYSARELLILDDDDDPSFANPPTDKNVSYLRQARVILGQKRNLLCAAAAGDLIMHWDSDDWSSPDRMEHQFECMNTDDFALSGYHSLLFWDERNGLGYRWTGTSGYACGASLCYWKEFWKANPFPDVSVAEDNAMVLAAGRAIATADGGQHLIARVHGANTSSAQRIGQNNWPLAHATEFPPAFFAAIHAFA